MRVVCPVSKEGKLREGRYGRRYERNPSWALRPVVWAQPHPTVRATIQPVTAPDEQWDGPCTLAALPAMLAAGESATGSVLTCSDLNSPLESRQGSMGLEHQTIAGLVITGERIWNIHSASTQPYFFTRSINCVVLWFSTGLSGKTGPCCGFIRNR